MSRVRASLSLAVLVAASLLLTAPAQAGGPTSALLSVPGQGKTASVYYTDPEYDALAGLVGVTSGAGTVDSSGRSHAAGAGVTVTWLIHDVMPWRVDHIYLTGEGAPWIATQLSDESGGIWDSEVVWHQPTSPSELVGLLNKLGVGAASVEAEDFTGVAGAPLPDQAETAGSTTRETTTAAEPAPADTSTFTGVWWALGGLAAGVLLMALWGRRGRGETEPATEPRDETADGPELVGAEELSWP